MKSDERCNYALKFRGKNGVYFNEQDKRLAQNDFLSAWMPLKYWYFYDSAKK